MQYRLMEDPNASIVVTLIIAVITQLVSMAVLIWYASARFTTIETSTRNNGIEIAKVESKMDKHIDDFSEHVIDPRVHTTEEQRRDIFTRIDRLDTKVDSNFRDLGNKLDSWGRLLSK